MWLYELCGYANYMVMTQKTQSSTKDTKGHTP